MALTTKQDMIDEIKQALADGEELSDIGDNSHEYVDGYMPIYYNEIINEWQNMPSDYDNEGIDQYGLPEEVTIYNLMSLDLLNYYSNLFSEALSDVESESDDESENE
jgi:hypothetical protein